MRIDSHHHFWTVGRYDMPWMVGDVLKPILKTYTQDNLRPYVEKHEIDRTVLVQTISSVPETQWFLQLAEQTDFIGGVVGWVDLTDPGVGDTIDEINGPRLVGIRHQVHDEEDVNWLLREDVQRGIAAVGHRGLVYDLLLKPPHLAPSLKTVRALDSVSFVIDHIAKPAITSGGGGGGWDDWAGGIKALADCPNVACKISGMTTEADWANWTPGDLKRYSDHVIESFGIDRVMYGSDWPVCELAGTYDQVIEALETNTASLSADEKLKLFGANAARLYGLED